VSGHAILRRRVQRVRRELRRLPVGSDSDYEQQRREVLHRDANTELHNSDERNFMK